VLIDLDSAALEPAPDLLAAAAALAGPEGRPEGPPGPAGPGGRPEVPVAPAGPDPRRWVLTGGEDHALAATFPPATALPAHWRVIGRVRQGQGVRLDGRPFHGPAGWEHFRAS
jgi:hypothetical protein